MSQLDLSPRGDQPIIGVVAGSGLIARAAVAAKADFLMVLNAGLYRTLGSGSLASFMPYGNANRQTELLLREQILPQSNRIPVVAGVFAADPTLDIDTLLRRYKELGVAGVTNWPAVGFVDGKLRAAMEAQGWGTELEIDTLRRARAIGLGSFGFVLSRDEAQRFALHCDAMILDLGLTQRIDDIHHRADQVHHAIARLNGMLEAVASTGRRPLQLAFGGPVTTAEDVEQLMLHTDVDGFAGGSVFERLPVRSIVETTVRRFKSVTCRSRSQEQAERRGELIGRSPAMIQLFASIEKVAPHDVNVCIHGETGSGKELVAVHLHRLSRRARGPMVTLNCGAIPDGLLESELFGHEKGAFTGADRRRLGKFELAHHGTLFLDEIADLSPRGQVALLRAIQAGEVTRIGGEHRLDLDVRIIAASHQDLERLVREGRFREDLYYRLNQITLHVPPLRDRIEDLPLLVRAILARLSVQLNRELAGVSDEFLARLGAYTWPGNVRQLEHVICRSAILEGGPILYGLEWNPAPAVGTGSKSPPQLQRGRRHPDRFRAAGQALAQAHGNKRKAAALLGISRKTLYTWLRLDSPQEQLDRS